VKRSLETDEHAPPFVALATACHSQDVAVDLFRFPRFSKGGDTGKVRAASRGASIKHGSGSERSDCRTRFSGLRENARILGADTEAGLQALTSTMKSLVEQLHRVREDVVELHDLRARLERLEKKVGFRH